jgi:hypothetical protein
MHWRGALAGKCVCVCVCVYERPMARIGVMDHICLYTVSCLEYARVALYLDFYAWSECNDGSLAHKTVSCEIPMKDVWDFLLAM